VSYYQKCKHRELDWFLQPHWKANILRREGDFSFMDIVEWNMDEVEARFEYYKPRFVKTWDFDFKNINNLKEYYRMFYHFEIEYKKVKTIPKLDKNPQKDPMQGNALGAMKRNWHLKGMKKWRFPLDIQQIR